MKEEVSKDAHMEVKKESNEAAVDTERAGGNEVSLLRKATFKLAETRFIMIITGIAGMVTVCSRFRKAGQACFHLSTKTIWYFRRTRTKTSIANKHEGLQACSGPLNAYFIRALQRQLIIRALLRHYTGDFRQFCLCFVLAASLHG